MSRSDGRAADLGGYIYGCHPGLNPHHAAAALGASGFDAPCARHACELGFGQGVSINVHAAADPDCEWWGTDVLPEHAAFARGLAGAAGSGARLFDQSFDEFCARTDLPDFDFIGLHGVWSWVSDADRGILVDFVRRRLRPGGIVYLGYNTLPGWAPMLPLRDLLLRHAEVMSAPGLGAAARVDEALAFARRLMATHPLHASYNPQVGENLKAILDQPPAYVAHEYFAREWRPMSFAELAEALGPARLAFACPALARERVEALDLTPAQRAFLADIPDPTFRETTRDLMTDRRLRREYWLRGAPRPAAGAADERLRRLRFVLTAPRPDSPPTIARSHDDVVLPEAAVGPVLDALADRRPTSLGHIERALAAAGGMSLGNLLQTTALLAAAGAVLPAREDDDAIERARPGVAALNAVLLDRARHDGNVNHLASPVTGGGVAVPRLHQLFLAARQTGRATPEDWADHARAVLPNDAGATAEAARRFKADDLPTLEALGIA